MVLTKFLSIQFCDVYVLSLPFLSLYFEIRSVLVHYTTNEVGQEVEFRTFQSITEAQSTYRYVLK